MVMCRMVAYCNLSCMYNASENSACLTTMFLKGLIYIYAELCSCVFHFAAGHLCCFTFIHSWQTPSASASASNVYSALHAFTLKLHLVSTSRACTLQQSPRRLRELQCIISEQTAGAAVQAQQRVQPFFLAKVEVHEGHDHVTAAASS